jgi:hypothetical protein
MNIRDRKDRARQSKEVGSRDRHYYHFNRERFTDAVDAQEERSEGKKQQGDGETKGRGIRRFGFGANIARGAGMRIPFHEVVARDLYG